MEQFETGMMARSKSGHDAGKVYVITKVEEAYVYLVDGKVRTLDKPKKKKKKKKNPKRNRRFCSLLMYMGNSIQ